MNGVWTPTVVQSVAGYLIADRRAMLEAPRINKTVHAIASLSVKAVSSWIEGKFCLQMAAFYMQENTTTSGPRQPSLGNCISKQIKTHVRR